MKSEAWIFGIHAASQSSPCLTTLFCGAHAECMSLHWLGVMKLYAATVPAARSASRLPLDVPVSMNGRMCARQRGEAGSLVFVTSSKNTMGLCFGLYSPTLVRGQTSPLMSSWYDIHVTPAVSSNVTR